MSDGGSDARREMEEGGWNIAGPKKRQVPDQITITKLRCARCDKPFEVVNMDSKTEFFCPHPKCKCRHIKLDGSWYDEVVLKLRAVKAEKKD